MSLKRLQVSWRALPVLVFFLVAAVLWLRWPIVAFDFDLWYHLAGGRYILQHLAVPTTPFFSYLSVPTGWVDYYWLFQVLAEGLYRLDGYVVLIVLRAGLYLGTIALVYRYVREAQPEEDAWGSLLAILIACAFALALIPRELLLRPHAFTYLYILVLHFSVNFRRRWVWWLPPATVIWANLHGVEYPVVMAVSFFNTGVTRTDIAITQLQVDAKLQLVLENMIQDATYQFSNDLSGFSSKVGEIGSANTLYGNIGNGTLVSYYIANKQFVCPNTTGKTFDVAANSNQFLLVTIKPDASSGVSLTYIFSNSNSVVTNKNAWHCSTGAQQQISLRKSCATFPEPSSSPPFSPCSCSPSSPLPSPA